MQKPTVNGHTRVNGSSAKRDTQPASEPIAIVGMSCKFGGDASSPAKLWENIAAGKDTWSPIPDSRFDVKSLYHPDPNRIGKHNVKGGYFIDEDLFSFDAAFFSQTADAASAMDPQLRLLMEGVFEAIENAGLKLDEIAGSNTSVYSGVFGRDNSDMLMKDPETIPTLFITGNGLAMFSNRISHFFNFQGPSMTIDVGCSGSMAALHLATQSLRSGESDMSIVGASAALLNPDLYIALSTGGILNPEGRCFAWDHRWGGYGRGEGCAVLVLKRLDAALENGDHVHAVIRETAMNQDGKTGTITSPSSEAQKTLIEQCYKQAGLDMADVGYVEAHMTGTGGDPIEAASIAQTIASARSTQDPLYVGSIKTNIGHTEAVSGIASVIKATLVLQHQAIPPNLNYEKTNPNIPLEDWNVRVPTSLIPWPNNRPLRVSVNNFGYGGSNIHLILEAPPSSMAPGPGYDETCANGATVESNGARTNGDHVPGEVLSASYVYVISSKEATSTKKMSTSLAAHLRSTIESGHAPSPLDLAYTLAERRSRFPYSMTVRARGVTDLASRLDEPHRKAVRALQQPPRIGFIFTGQGAQAHAMGKELMQTYTVFEEAMYRAEYILTHDYGATWSLTQELLRDEESSRVHEVDLGQPLTVALQLCLVDLLGYWSIKPSAIVSHSSGEIAAAYAAGVLSFEEALGVVFYRGLLAKKHCQNSSAIGGMLAARLSEKEAEDYIKNLTKGQVVVACINSPDSVTLSGDMAALDEIAATLDQEGVLARKLKVPMAYHSHHMVPMSAEYAKRLGNVLLDQERTPSIPLASPVTGSTATFPEAYSAKHWVRNLVSPVLFSQAVEDMVFGGSEKGQEATNQATNVDVLIEVGPHDTLAGPVRQTLGNKARLPYFSCLKRNVNAVETMQDLVCELLSRGHPVNLAAVNLLDQGPMQPKYIPDLPSYAWNHSSSYHIEPRVSREHRHRRFKPHELLGTPVPGTNKHMPTWRNFLRVQDIPWLADHQLEQQVVLPGAGFIAMAIEAIRQLKAPPPGASSGLSVAGFRLRDVALLNALLIPSAQNGVETMLYLRPCSERDLDHRDWYDFEVWSISGSGSNVSWIQHSTGSVSMDMKKSAKTIEAGDHHASSPPDREEFLKTRTTTQQPTHLEPEDVFSNMAKMDFQYGPTFRNLIGSRVVGKRAVTEFNLAPIALDLERYGADYVLHPTTLDSIFQSCFGCLAPHTQEAAVFLPRRIGNMFVPLGFGAHEGHRLAAFTELLHLAQRDARFEITAGPAMNVVDKGSHGALPDGETETACLRVAGLQLSRIQEGSAEKMKQKRRYAKTRWEPDILQNIPPSIKDGMKVWLAESELDFHRRLRESAYHFIRDAYSQIDPTRSGEWQWHIKKYFDWMQTFIHAAESGEFEEGSQNWIRRSQSDKEPLFESIKVENAMGEMVCKIGSRLAGIINGEITPLELMMEDGLLHRVYEEGPEKGRLRCLRHQSRLLLELFIAKEPGAKVIEVGAGTGGATEYALQTLTRGGRDVEGSGTLLGHYDFTDISAGFFEPAKAKFASYASVMGYHKLDIEIDPEQQGFTTGSYDLVLAAEVLHATKNLVHTLTNIRKLLKPGGKLMLAESTRASPDSQLIFGTLPGWWLSEEPERAGGPLVEVETWDRYLRASGFTGVEFDVGDCEDGEVMFSTLMLTTAVAPAPSLPQQVSLVYETGTPKAWLDGLVNALHNQTGTLATLEAFSAVQTQSDRTYIVLTDMARPLIDDMTKQEFEKVQSLLVRSHGLLWLSCGAWLDTQEPLAAQTQGILRTLRREDAAKRIVQLDFDSGAGNSWTTEAIGHIVHVFQQCFDHNIDKGHADWEYAASGPMLHVARIYPDVAQDNACDAAKKPTPEDQSFYSPIRDLVWDVPDNGLLDKLQWNERPRDDEPLPEGMVEIEARCFGLNFRDVLIAMGMLMPDQDGRVHEAAGVVTRLGPGTEESGFVVGDRVCGVFDGFFASRSRALWMGAAKIPASMSFEEAVSIPYAFVTAYHGLITVANLQAGERVLIHAAAGGVGQAAVMLAQDLSAEVFVTCGSEEKRRLLMERYAIPADHIFTSRDVSFAQELKAVCPEGIDVVLNSLAGPLLKATWECLARFGRFVEIGKMDIESNKTLDMTPFGRGVTFSAVDLSLQRLYSPRIVHDTLVKCVELCAKDRVSPVHPITTWPVDEMDQAMKFMQAGKHTGKIVVQAQPDAQVPVLQHLASVDLNDAHSTYLVVGGTTGLGHAIASFMINKNAANLLVVSRKATSHERASDLRQKASSRGCNLQIIDCDISDESAFLAMLEHAKSIMPPIRGVVQCGMVLDDSVLERMEYEQWQHAVAPKVAGTLNLHKHLCGLRFFIMLSSTAGVCGNVSQSNYGAGNTFQDALARHRTARRLPAVTIDLGRVEEVGYVNDAPAEVQKRLESSYGTLSIPLGHLMRLVEQAIREPLRSHADDSQIITSISSLETLPDDSTTRGDKRYGTLRLGNTSGALLTANSAGSTRVDELVRELVAIGAAAADGDDQAGKIKKAGDIVRALLAVKIGEIFNIDASEVDLGLPLTHYGVDSLVAVQMRNWMTSTLHARVTIFEILQTESLHDFANLIASRSTLVVKEAEASGDVKPEKSGGDEQKSNDEDRK